MSEPGTDRLRVFFGAALLGVGALMAALCGLCTGAFLVAGLWPKGGEAEFIPIALVMGGVPTALGVLMFWAGRRMLRGRAPPAVEVFGDEPEERP